MRPIIAVPAIAALVYRAYSKKSLTPSGIFVAFLTAIAHAVHPWNLPFVLLAVFFLAGTRVTHVKEEHKKKLTVNSTGASGSEGPRTHVQVLANSVMASFFSLLHAYQLRLRDRDLAAASSVSEAAGLGAKCFSWGGDLLVIGMIANYACVAADTFSSELGILAKSQPRLITSLMLRKVPRGTNGGVTLLGLGAGLLGSMVIVTASMLFIPFCSGATSGMIGGGTAWTVDQRRTLILGLTIWGLLGSVMDSILGGLFQRSVRDVRSGKIVEGDGGARVLVTPGSPAGYGKGEEAVKRPDDAASGQPPEAKKHAKYDPKDKHRRASFGDEKSSRIVENGWDLLDNNDVNFLMAFIMSIGAMAVGSWYWDVPLSAAFAPFAPVA